MTTDELGHKELELYYRVISIQGTMEEKYSQIENQDIFEEYKKIHQQYAKLNRSNLEALKRGLFLIWYSRIEPSCYTGLNELDSTAENLIIRTLDRRLRNAVTDYELDWMLDYYSNWAFLFDDFKDHHDFYSRLITNTKVDLPDSINRKEMAARGQMGIYWNSLTRYSK